MKKLFTKSLMAVGVAGLMGLTSVAMAQEFGLTGSIRAGYTSVDAATKTETIGANISSRIDLNASTDLGNGQSTGAELSYNVGGDLDTRRQNVWLDGGWGRLTLGQHGGIYRSAANWDQASYLGGNVRFDDDAGGDTGLIYASNIPGPFSFDIEIASIAPVTPQVGLYIVTNAAGIVMGGNLNSANPGEGIFRGTEAAAELLLGANATDQQKAAQIDVVRAEVTAVRGRAIGRWAATAHYAFSDASDATTLHLGYHNNDSAYKNIVLSVNGSAGGVGYYLAYETSKHQVGNNDANTVGLFLSYDAGDNRVYLEYEDASGNNSQATLVGYRRDLGAGVDFTAEYATVKPADSKNLNLVLKYDF